MKKWMLLCLTLLASPFSLGQNCGMVVDDAHVLTASAAPLQAAADKLIAEGAEPHFVTFSGKPQNLDILESSLEITCAATWRGVGGQRKSTLLVLAVAPEAHKLGLYYGSAWHRALDDHWNRIKTDAIAPRFRDGNWAGGFVAGAEQLAARLAASKDEALHPVAATTVNQATDYSGLWSDFKLLLIILLCLGGAGLLTWLAIKWLTRKSEAKGAQLDAQAAKNNAMAWLDHVKECLDELVTAGSVADGAAGTQNIRERDVMRARGLSRYNNLRTEYAALVSSSRMDPAENGLPVDVYRSMEKQYDAIIDKARAIDTMITGDDHRYTLPKDASPEEIKQREPKGTESWTTGWNPSGWRTPSETNSTVIINETTVENGTNNSRAFAAEAPQDDSSLHGWSTGHSHSDGGGGGSSSWSSSDSSSDYGGSSSFDSGGGSFGDSGGGGSSDF